MVDLAPITQVLAHVPPDVQKSLWRAVGTLIGKVAEWPAALIDGKIQVVKADAAAKVKITEALAEAAAVAASQDPALVGRALNQWTHRLIREQKNREEVVRLALDEITKDPPQESNGVVDDDWLDIFSRYAERRSDLEMRAYLARVLAGEIRRPGSFSPAAIEVLAKVTTYTAALFRSFCNASIELPGGVGPFLVADPFPGSPGENSLQAIGLSYSRLADLQDAGLVQGDLNAYHTLPSTVFAMPTRIGGSRISVEGGVQTPKPPQRITTLNYTRAGREIRSIVDLGTDEVYLAKYREWIKTQFGLTLVVAVNAPAPEVGPTP
jgi:hypothetical protein